MSDVRTAAHPDEPAVPVAPAVPARRAAAPLSADSALAVEIRDLVERGEMDEARDRFGELVAMHQRRASRIAYHYLRDASDADEAVQDAFLKVFSHISAYREAWPFEVWFTRILINGCLDRRRRAAAASDGSSAANHRCGRSTCFRCQPTIGSRAPSPLA